MKVKAIDAVHAHTNLNTFAAVAALLESGLLYGGQSDAAANKIIAICHDEQRRLLAKYDAAIDKLSLP